MKGIKSRKVCCYCHKIIGRKPIPVGDSSYAHGGCKRKNAVGLNFLYGGVRRRLSKINLEERR